MFTETLTNIGLLLKLRFVNIGTNPTIWSFFFCTTTIRFIRYGWESKAIAYLSSLSWIGPLLIGLKILCRSLLPKLASSDFPSRLCSSPSHPTAVVPIGQAEHTLIGSPVFTVRRATPVRPFGPEEFRLAPHTRRRLIVRNLSGLLNSRVGRWKHHNGKWCESRTRRIFFLILTLFED